MSKIKTSLEFNEELWLKFKQKCVGMKLKYSKQLETFMEEWLKT